MLITIIITIIIVLQYNKISTYKSEEQKERAVIGIQKEWKIIVFNLLNSKQGQWKEVKNQSNIEI